MGLEAGLVIYLIETNYYNNYALILPVGVPLAILLVIGCMLLVNRILKWEYRPRTFEFKNRLIFVPKAKKKEEKKRLIEPKVLRPRTLTAPKIEYGTHNCPQHGSEKCMGSFSNIHSCNSPDATKVTFWQE